MSRHRNVRSMRYSDEYDGYDDEYGHSVEDDYSISPSDAAFMYDRSSQQQQLSSYVRTEEDIAEEDEAISQENLANNLNELDRAKLMSCLDELRNVLGDSLPEMTLVECIIDSKFDATVALDKLLNMSSSLKKDQAIDSPKPQRTNVRPRGRGGRARNFPKNHKNNDEIKDLSSGDKIHSYSQNPGVFDVQKFLENDKKNIELNLYNAVIIGNKKSDSKVETSTIDKTSFDLLHPDVDSLKNNEETTNHFVLRNMSVDELQKIGPSMFGYFVCKRLIEFNSNCVCTFGKHDSSCNKIIPFDFKSQSPDDVGLCNRKWKD